MARSSQSKKRIGWDFPGRIWAWLGRPGPWAPGWTPPQRGQWGEKWARWYYFHKRGAAILESNWHGGGGEIDLILREGQTLVFVEVKLRNARDPEPLAAVRAAPRRRRFRESAEAYVKRLPKPRPEYRFDVLLVTPDPEHPRAPQINCLVDVFRSSQVDGAG